MTPQAILMPDQGTTPIKRSMDKRIHGADEWSLLLAPSRAERVLSNALGKYRVRKGARGLESIVAQIEPRVVSRVRRRVAYAGEKSAPAKTFWTPVSTSAFHRK